MKQTLAACALLLSLVPPPSFAAKPLTRDEGEFLKQPVDFSREEEQEKDARWLKAPEQPYPFPKASLAKERGVLTLSVDGETIPTWMVATGGHSMPGSPVERQLREAGARFFIIDVGLTSDYNEERTLENAPDAAFAQFQKRAESVLKAVPDAQILVRLWMTNVGKDFAEKYPDALLQGENGNSDWGFAYPPSAKHHGRPNMLNEWRRYCAEHLHRFIHRLGRSDYAPRVAGFYLAAMNSGEWWYYKGKGDPGWDYSPTRKAAFERFARAKYGDDRTAIAKAWRRADDEDLFRLPSLKERQQRPLLPNSPCIDYLQVLNQPVSNAARYFAQVVRAATSGHSLVGMEIHMGGVTYPNNGTVFMNHLIDAPEIDFFGGPSDYHHRRPGASPFYRVALASLEAHGKLWLNEGDYRTPTAFDTRSGGAGEPPMEPRTMREVLQREFARGAVFNYSTYLMDFGWAWFYEPAFLRDMGELLRADAFLRKQGLERRADIAFVTDQESQLFGNYFANPTTLMLKEKLDRTGLAWDFYELRDLLEQERYRRYKMVVFLNTIALSDEERAGIEKLKGEGRLLFWMYNPGSVDLSQQGRDAAELASALTGLTMKIGTRPGTVTLQPEAFGKLGVQQLPNTTLGSDEEAKQTRLNREVSLSDSSAGQPIGNLPSRIYSIDPEATVLGTDAAGRAFFAMRQFPDWTSIYTAFCEVEPWVIREFARLAGCHIWSDSDDVLFAAGNYVGIHAVRDGEKRLSLPKKSGVFEVFEGEVISKGSDEIKLSMQRGETRFFYLGDSEEAAGVWAEARSEQAAARTAFRKVSPAPPVVDAQFRYHLPKPPQATGKLEMLGIHRFQAPALLISGPYASDAESIAALDRSLSQSPAITSWSNAKLEPEHFGREADRFLHVVHPREDRDPNAPLGWYALANPGSWISDYQIGIATGQSYVLAYQLTSSEPTRILLYAATQGEAALWVEGKPIEPNASGFFETIIPLSEKPTQILLRVRGNNLPTGFTVKVAGARRGSDVYSIPGSGVGTVAANEDALIPPPESIRLLLPEKSSP